MKVVLPEHLVEKLCVLPESGEGYQRVRISTASGDKHGNLIVLGCNELYVPDTLKLAATEIEDIELDVPKSID
ncbi:hypothetical protein ACKI1Z_41245, partial [Streptomyces galilaeus]|uniref:hypothetical protein n=2 Tax=Streptomyces TaxID=1883 RepID=UPI0038F75CCD